MKVFGPKAHQGIDVICGEIDRLSQLNSQHLRTIETLEQRIKVLEKIIESYLDSSSGTNNTVLPWNKCFLQSRGEPGGVQASPSTWELSLWSSTRVGAAN